MVKWYVATVRIGKEFQARDDLADLGATVYCPVFRRMTRPKRKRKPVWSEKPAFPGYLFVKDPLPCSVPELKRIKDFFSFIRFGQEIGYVDNSLIESLKEREVNNMWDDAGISSGDKVVVTSGAFAHYTGIVVKCEKTGIIVCLSDKEKEINIPPFLLQVIQP